MVSGCSVFIISTHETAAPASANSISRASAKSKIIFCMPPVIRLSQNEFLLITIVHCTRLSFSATTSAERRRNQNCREIYSCILSRSPLARPWRPWSAAVIRVKSKLEFGCFGHKSRMPLRLKDDLHADFSYFRQLGELSLHICLEDSTHAAAGRSHGHLNVNQMAALFVGSNSAGVNQAQVGYVDGNLRIIHGP